jgi:peptide/nickel transport system substrate-binding protein
MSRNTKVSRLTFNTPILVIALAWPLLGALAAETPKRGGILTYVVPAEPPSFDGHREATSGT